MGNEMGNNNTSGLKEEENTNQEKAGEIATPADDVKEQNIVVPAAEDDNKDATEKKEKGLGVGDPHVDNKNSEGKEEETEKSEAQETSLQETGKICLDDVKGDNHVVPVAVDGNSNGQETGLAEKQKHVDKEEDNTKIEAMEQYLLGAAHADEAGGENCVTRAAEGEDCNGEAGLVSSGLQDIGDHLVNMTLEGTPEKVNTKAEAQEKSTQENRKNCLDDLKEENHAVHPDGNGNSHGNETGLTCSNDPERLEDSQGGNRKQEDKDENKMDVETHEQSLHGTGSVDDVQGENHWFSRVEGEGCDNKEAVLASADSDVASNHLGKMASEGRSKQVKAEDHPPPESPKVEIPIEAVGEEDSEIQPASSSNNSDHCQKPQDLNQDENQSGRRQQLFKKQNSVKKENEGTGNSASDPLSASLESIPQEPAGLKVNEHEMAKMYDDQFVQYCNGMQKSVDTMGCKENDHISYTSISNYLGESVSSDPDEEVEKEKYEFLVKEMASGEQVSGENKVELEDGDEIQDNSGNITAKISDLDNAVGNKCKGETATEMDVIRNYSLESKLEDIPTDKSTIIHLEDSKNEGKGIVLTGEIIILRKESENGENNLGHFRTQSFADPMEESKPDEENAAASEFMMMESGSDNEKDCQTEVVKMAEDGASEEQQRDTQKEAPLFSNPALIPADFSLIGQRCEEDEEPKEKKIVEEAGGKNSDTCPTASNTDITKERKEQPASFLNPSRIFQAFSENQHQNNEVGSKKVQSSKQDSQFAEQNHESYGGTDDSTFVTKNLTEESVVSVVELAGEKPLQNISQHPEDMERLNSDSSPDSIIDAQMQKSPSFNLDLRINSRPEESDHTPLLFQDKATVEGKPNQAGVPPGKPVVNVKNEHDSFPYEDILVEEKVVALERSYSEMSGTPFLGFLKDEEEEEEETSNLITPKKEENHNAAKKKISVSVKEVSSALTKGKEKRKHRPSFFFSTCMCCATV